MPVSAKLTSDQDQKQAAAAAAAGRNTAKSEQVVDDDFHNMEPASGRTFIAEKWLLHSSDVMTLMSTTFDMLANPGVFLGQAEKVAEEAQPADAARPAEGGQVSGKDKGF